MTPETLGKVLARAFAAVPASLAGLGAWLSGATAEAILISMVAAGLAGVAILGVLMVVARDG